MKSCVRGLALCGMKLKICIQWGWQRPYLAEDTAWPLAWLTCFLAGPALSDMLPCPAVSLVASDASQCDRGRLGLHGSLCLLSAC